MARINIDDAEENESIGAILRLLTQTVAALDDIREYPKGRGRVHQTASTVSPAGRYPHSSNCRASAGSSRNARK